MYYSCCTDRMAHGIDGKLNVAPENAVDSKVTFGSAFFVLEFWNLRFVWTLRFTIFDEVVLGRGRDL